MPSNLNFDSARMLEKNQVEIQGSGSYYVNHDANFEEVGEDLTQLNFGFRFGLGITEKYNFKLKTEFMMPSYNYVDYNIGQLNMLYVELDNKFRLGENAAFSLPLGLYVGDFPAIQLDPRFYITVIPSDKFDFTIIPKCHISGLGAGGIIPGISVGAGFSSDLTKWAIRPEIGYDLWSLSGGVSISYMVKSGKKRQGIYFHSIR